MLRGRAPGRRGIVLLVAARLEGLEARQRQREAHRLELRDGLRAWRAALLMAEKPMSITSIEWAGGQFERWD